MKKLLMILAVLVIFGLLAWGGTASHQLTTTDQFCASCHAYEKTSWDHGPHAQAGCLDCHTGGFVRDKTQGLRKVFLTLTGQMDPHHDVLASYPDKTMTNCMGCHFDPVVAAANPVFVERHGAYLRASETCLGCHEGGHDERLRAMRFTLNRTNP